MIGPRRNTPETTQSRRGKKRGLVALTQRRFGLTHRDHEVRVMPIEKVLTNLFLKIARKPR